MSISLGAGETIKGECNCPAFGHDGFCKHMVATALAANATGHAHEELRRARRASALISKDKLNGVRRDDRRTRRARSSPVPQAGDRLGRLTAHEDAGGAPRQGVFHQATATRGFVDYGEAGGWGGRRRRGARPPRGSGREADAVLKLAEHAIDRIETAIESIDDFDGECRTCSSARATSTPRRPAAPGRTRSRSRATSSSARPATVTERSTARPGSMPRFSARPDWPNIAGSLLGCMAEAAAAQRAQPKESRRRLCGPLGNSRPVRRARQRRRGAHRAARQGPVVAVEVL